MENGCNVQVEHDTGGLNLTYVYFDEFTVLIYEYERNSGNRFLPRINVLYIVAIITSEEFTLIEIVRVQCLKSSGILYCIESNVR